MSFEFDEAIALTPVGEHEYAAELGDRWQIGAAVNGGVLMATLGHAIALGLPAKPDPFAFSAHFMSASRPGPAQVTTRVIRDGGTVATVEAELSQEGQQRIAVLATYGDLSRLPDDVRTSASPVQLPPVEQCVSHEMAPSGTAKVPPLMQRLDVRFDPACVGWALGEPSGNGELRAWFRMKDGREPDPLQLLLVLDALPPVTFDLGLMGWAPTLELTAHVRARPAPGWLAVCTSTSNLAGGLFEEDCEVWDSTGRLVAQSRQLAMVPR